MPSFYENKGFLNTVYAVDIAIENHLSGLLFDGNITRIEYSSLGYAFRKRLSSTINSSLNLPFLSYRIDDFKFGLPSWWNARAQTKGVFIDELQKKIRLSPVTLQYEASFWCNRNDENQYAFTELRFDADNKTTLFPIISINDIDDNPLDIPFAGQLGYTNLKYDPKFKENDWIEQNRIHSIRLDFELLTFVMKENSDVSIPLEVLMEFSSKHGFIDEDYVSSIDEPDRYDYVFNLVVDHLNGEVID